jgi:hypothetical protein
MRFLRPVARYTLLDQKRVKIFNLTEKIERQRENWYGHILRMTADSLPMILLNYKQRRRRSYRTTHS